MAASTFGLARLLFCGPAGLLRVDFNPDRQRKTVAKMEEN
jgi:hypothetical protein